MDVKVGDYVREPCSGRVMKVISRGRSVDFLTGRRRPLGSVVLEWVVDGGFPVTMEIDASGLIDYEIIEVVQANERYL